MKRYTMATLVAAALLASCGDRATAQQPFGFGFQPFGFYQPYGINYRSRTPTPPYFALNPPVYYGARYSRPYGISPFASPPVVAAPQGYQGRLRSDFDEGPYRESGPRKMGHPLNPTCNPYIHVSSRVRPDGTGMTAQKKGEVRENPFFKTSEQLVAK